MKRCTQRLRIAFFIDSLFSGGAQRQCVELAVALVRQDLVDARVFVYRPAAFFEQRLREQGIPVELIPKSRKADPFFASRLRSSLLSSGVDVVHAFMIGPSVWAALACTIPRRCRRPRLVASERSGRVADTFTLLWKWRIAFRCADAVTANTENVAQAIRRKLRIPSDRIHLIPNGIDFTWWDEQLKAESTLTFDPDLFHIGVVGRLEPEKNHVLLLRSLAHLSPEVVSRLRVWFIGSQEAETSCRDEIDRAVREHGLDGVVRFVGPQRQIAPLIARFQLLALPSRVEGFPNVVLEAMASRVPVVATRVGEVANLVEEGGSGYVVESEDDAEMGRRIDQLFRMSPAQRLTLGLRGRAIAEERYPMSAVAESWLELYRSLLR